MEMEAVPTTTYGPKKKKLPDAQIAEIRIMP
jgi:hypothetical protein